MKLDKIATPNSYKRPIVILGFNEPPKNMNPPFLEVTTMNVYGGEGGRLVLLSRDLGPGLRYDFSTGGLTEKYLGSHAFGILEE